MGLIVPILHPYFTILWYTETAVRHRRSRSFKEGPTSSSMEHMHSKRLETQIKTLLAPLGKKHYQFTPSLWETIGAFTEKHVEIVMAHNHPSYYLGLSLRALTDVGRWEDWCKGNFVSNTNKIRMGVRVIPFPIVWSLYFFALLYSILLLLLRLILLEFLVSTRLISVRYCTT